MKECYKCGFNDEDLGCTCPHSDRWYACPIENKKPENIQLLQDCEDFLAEATVQVVIDIPEEVYKDIMIHNREMREGGKSTYYFEGLIQHGIPLPKGHGRLIDADALPLNAIDDANYGSNYIRIAPTIIEADKESEGNNDKNN